MGAPMSVPWEHGEPVPAAHLCPCCGEPGDLGERDEVCSRCQCAGCGDPRAWHRRGERLYCDSCASEDRT